MLGRRCERRFLAQHPRSEPAGTPAREEDEEDEATEPGRLLGRGSWTAAPRVGDAAIHAAQDKAHQAALVGQHVNDMATALAEAMRLEAEPQELALTGNSDRP